MWLWVNILTLEVENEAQLASGLSCKLLHLLHPFPFTHLLGVLQHIKRFYALLKDLHPRTENASIARQMFMELVETSGIDLNALENSLLELKEEIRSFAGRYALLPQKAMLTAYLQTALLTSLGGALPLCNHFQFARPFKTVS